MDYKKYFNSNPKNKKIHESYDNLKHNNERKTTLQLKSNKNAEYLDEEARKNYK